MSEELTTIGFVHEDSDPTELRDRYYEALTTIEGVEIRGSPDSFPRFEYEGLHIDISAPGYPEEHKNVTPDVPVLLFYTRRLSRMEHEQAVATSAAVVDLVVEVYDAVAVKPDAVYGLGSGQVHACEAYPEDYPYPIDANSIAEGRINTAAWLLILPGALGQRYDESVWGQTDHCTRIERLADDSLLVVLDDRPANAHWERVSQTLGLPSLD